MLQRYYMMYDIHDRGDGVPTATIRSEEHEYGDWVKYDDIKHLLEQADKKLELKLNKQGKLEFVPVGDENGFI